MGVNVNINIYNVSYEVWHWVLWVFRVCVCVRACSSWRSGFVSDMDKECGARCTARCLLAGWFWLRVCCVLLFRAYLYAYACVICCCSCFDYTNLINETTASNTSTALDRGQRRHRLRNTPPPTITIVGLSTLLPISSCSSSASFFSLDLDGDVVLSAVLCGFHIHMH